MKYFTVDDDFKQIIEKFLDCNISIEPISTGWTNFVFKVITENNKYIFRFPRNNFFSNVLIKEVSFLEYVKDKISTPVPNGKLVYDNSRPFTYHEMIPGRNLAEVYSTLTENEKEKIADQISNFIYELQQISLEDIKINLPTTSQFLAELSKVDSEYYDFNQHNALIEQEKNGSVLNHADLNPGNVLLDKNNNVCAIIDFAFVSKSSKINDISRLIGRLPKEFHETMLNAYNKKFNSNIGMDEVNLLIDMWDYVDAHYINYMIKNHPEVDIRR